jgi:hypothetical protein
MAQLILGSVDAESYTGSAFISGTAATGILPIGVPTKLINTILSDGSDVTYFALFGGNGTDRSLGTQFASAIDRVPSNSVISSVSLALRARNNPLTCDTNPVFEVWTVWLGADPGRQVATLTLTDTFADYLVPAPVNPFTGGPWSDLSPALVNGAIFGWRGRTDCIGTGGNIESQWSEASLVVGIELPEPTVSTLPTGYLGMGAAELRGSFNPNQDGAVEAAASFAPAKWFFEFGDTAETLIQVSAAQGDYTGTTPFTVTFLKDLLTPATRYFYRIGVLVDGETFYGDTLDFTTPTTDPSLGAF